MKYIGIIWAALLLALSVPQTVYGTGVDDYDFTDVQKVVDTALESDSVNVIDLIKSLVLGKASDFPRLIKEFLWNKTGRELAANRGAIAQIIMIAAVGAIFTNFSTIFTKSQISETGFYITYLLLITLLAAAFSIAGSIAAEVMDNLLKFMKAMMPSYFIAAAFAGGSVTSIAFYEFTMMLVSVVQWVLLKMMLPAINIFMMLTLVNHLSKDPFLSKFLELFKTIIDWILKTILGLVIGYNLIQSMILPYADAVKTSAVGKLIQIIPGIGQGANAVTEVILGTGVLIKNGIGTAALILMVLMSALPLLKLAVITIMYKGAAAFVQPISDKRIVSCIDSISEGTKLLLRVVFTALLLFLVTVGVVCSATNVTYFAG